MPRRPVNCGKRSADEVCVEMGIYGGFPPLRSLTHNSTTADGYPIALALV